MPDMRRTTWLMAAILGGIVLTSSLGDTSAPHVADIVKAPAPKFEISQLHDRVLLRGHTVNRQHEQTLLNLAGRLFPNQAVDARFEPLGIVPTHWQDSSTKLLHAVRAVDFARASLEPEEAVIRGVTRNPDDARAGLATLRDALPATAELHVDTVEITTGDAQMYCRRAFDEFKATPIQFRRSTTELRPSAYPVLQRIAVLGDACRSASLRIVGHTDAGGDESINQALSLKRAQTVVHELSRLGIAAERLTAIGKGSSLPVATNDTHYGRSLNRRIEVEFLAE